MPRTEVVQELGDALYAGGDRLHEFPVLPVRLDGLLGSGRSHRPIIRQCRTIQLWPLAGGLPLSNVTPQRQEHKVK